MKTVQYALVLVLLTAMWTPSGMAMGKRNPGDLVTVTGKIKVTGSMPLVRVVLVRASRQQQLREYHDRDDTVAHGVASYRQGGD